MFKRIKQIINGWWVSIVAILGIGGYLFLGAVNEPTYYCYAIYENVLKNELKIEMSCDDYDWLGAGPGDRRPIAPPGYKWTKAIKTEVENIDKSLVHPKPAITIFPKVEK